MMRAIHSVQISSDVFCRGLLTLCVALCMLSLSAQAQESRFITFDAPGADSTPGDYNGTYPSGINFWGFIAGSYQSADTVFHGFLRTPGGKFTTFQAPGADTTAGSYNGTYPNSINDSGVITGTYWDANGVSHGFLRNPDGKFTTFDVPGVGGYGTTPISINLEGAIAGYYTDSNYLFHSFVRHPDGTFSAFLAPGQCETNGSQGCYGSEVTNINFLGLSVGNYMDANLVEHGLIRHSGGTFTTFDAPGAGTGQHQGTGCPGCYAGLNHRGAIAGIYSDDSSVNHGFLRSPDGKLTTFDAPGAGTDSYQGTGCPSDCPVSLNDRGAIMGSYSDSNSVLHGYLRTPDGKIVTVDPLGSVFTLSSSMNDSGAITGYYLDANGVFHGFLRLAED